MKEKHGGFAIEFSKRGKSEFLVVESIAKTWRMVLRGDTEVYRLLKALWEDGHNEKNESAKAFINYVVSYTQTNFICSSITPDEQFLCEFVKSYEGYCKRVKATRGTVEEDSERDVLKEEMMKYQLSKELKEEDERESSTDNRKDGQADS